MNLLSGRHLESPEDDFPSPDSDMQIIVKWTLAPIPDISCVLLGRWVHTPRQVLPSSQSLPCLHSPFPPTSAGLSQSQTLCTQIEPTAKHCGPPAGFTEMTWRSPAPGSAVSDGNPLVAGRVGPGNIPCLVRRLPRDTCLSLVLISTHQCCFSS